LLFKILLEFITGYVSISVEGYYIERFINICISKNILLWNIKREKSSFLYANIGIKNFKKLKEIARKTKCRLELKEKKGIPFILHRYKKRKIFLILLILLLIAIYFASNFIWNIEVIGNEKINSEELIQDLNDQGLKIGMLKSKVNTKDIINNIRLKRQDIAWMGIEIDGTNAQINVVESSPKPDIINEDEYCNIVSDKVGVITKIVPQNGTALVKIGDIVKEGTILIGGWLEGKYTGTRYVHSNGEIQAKVWYSKREKMELISSVKKETGNEEKKYAIYFNNFKINLGKSIPKFEKYDTINEKKKLKLFSNFYLPIQIETNLYKEVNLEEIQYEKQEAVQILTEKIDKELTAEIQNTQNIVNKQVNEYEQDGYVEVEVIYEVLENIGTKEKIVF